MEKTPFVLCFSVSRNQIPDYNPDEANWSEKILDHVGDFKSLEEVVSKLTENLNLTESQIASIWKSLIKAEEEAQQVPPPPPPPSAADVSSKSTRKKMKKQASKLQTQSQLLDPADVEAIESMKKEISTTMDLLKIVLQLHKVLFPTRVGAGQVRLAAGNNISGQVRASAGNIISGQVRAAAGNNISGQVRAGNIISEQAGLRKHVGNRWE
ncbi:hypothetical protein AT2G42340 [Arabidopsis thaliana]|uniref:Uncharacterized protein n=1 Tax=Arabidopsis thaliana TaxID=3702 RepID=Q5BPR7_ARATH|nr:uncharacterized protein AT2G42340 [Arabidopsis thaliana]AAX23836.1 hypothetical protein At2g42340 [Arabidopsis thaliana]AEC10109.1 hypothetical protein AT2G42340 [Arabidopsis thaliana]|eukprot:NP_181763.2 hypothetical protein AT2G42340 [Arabidopsis thaliana]